MSIETPTQPLDDHLVLGPKSFLGLKSSKVKTWRNTLKNGRPPLHFLFDIPPIPAPTPTGSRVPGIATKYDAVVVWQTQHYRIAVGRWLFDYDNDRYFIAFVYPTTVTTFFNSRFGIVKTPHSSVKLSAFAHKDLPVPIAPTTNMRTPKFWFPIMQFLRFKAVLTIPVQTPVHIPNHASNGPIFVEAMGTTWALFISNDDTVLITDVASELVHRRELTDEVTAMRNLIMGSEEVDEPTVVDEPTAVGERTAMDERFVMDEGTVVDEDGNWI